MKNFALFTITIILLLTGKLTAQYSVGGENNNIAITITGVVQTINETNVEGSPYFENQLLTGIVHLPNKKTTESLNLALNLEENQLIYQEGEQFNIFNPSIIKGIEFKDKLGNTTAFFVTGFVSQENDINKNTPLRVVYNGEIKMFVHHTVTFDRGNFRDPVTNRKTAKYKKNEIFYLRKSDGEFVKTRLRLKNLINDIGEYEKELKDFAKKYKIKGKSESDANKLLEYYDSLKETNS
tara:strand:+ start:8799 stop:9512 length:714 start_codon:yes stop_codon:yes gene_type:complete